jgi:hypothetical protein
MKRNNVWFGGVLTSTLVVWGACIGNVMAASPTAFVIFSCVLTNPATGYTVLTYDASPSAPAKPSTDCATTLATLLADGLTNVNISVQTYTTEFGDGAPNGTDGTYITYVMTNGTLTSGVL